jgi:hypothetical protein
VPGALAPTAADDEPPLSNDLPARMASSPDLLAGADGAPDKPRARSVSGEIRVPVRRATRTATATSR